jgi:hypothetical protein
MAAPSIAVLADWIVFVGSAPFGPSQRSADYRAEAIVTGQLWVAGRDVALSWQETSKLVRFEKTRHAVSPDKRLLGGHRSLRVATGVPGATLIETARRYRYVENTTL